MGEDLFGHFVAEGSFEFLAGHFDRYLWVSEIGLLVFGCCVVSLVDCFVERDW